MYKIISHQRTENTLLLSVKRDLVRRPPIGMLAGFGVFALIALVSLDHAGSPAIFLLGCVAATACFAIVLRLAWIVLLRRTLFFDAGVLEVRDALNLEGFPGNRSKIYDRKNVPQPMSLVRTDAETRSRAEREKRTCYETVIPFCEYGKGGIVCLHRDKTRMLVYEEIFELFFREVPCDETRRPDMHNAAGCRNAGVPKRETAVPPTRIREKPCENKITQNEKPKRTRPDDAPWNDGRLIKSYHINRGDTPVDRGESVAVREKRSSEHGSRRCEPFRNDRSESGRANAVEPMVKLTQSTDAARGTDTLTFYSQKGDPLSIFLGHVSFYACRVVGYAAFFLLLGLYVHFFCYWNSLEPKLIEYGKTTFVPRYVPQRLRENALRNIRDYGETYGRNAPHEKEIVTIIAGFVGIVVVPMLLLNFAMRIVRWPFWKFWRLRLFHTTRRDGTRENEGEYVQGNDRLASRVSRTLLSPCFHVIQARPHMNPLITGRSFFDENPAWKQPYQVVLRSDWLSWVIPCADAGEQRRVATAIDDFLRTQTS